MGEFRAKADLPDMGFVEKVGNDSMLMIVEDGNGSRESQSMESSFGDSVDSMASSCLSELTEDASSSLSSSSSSSSSPSSSTPSIEPLYELSELMAQLPIKRGLSKYYHGRSQTFTSLASVKSLEDLAKRESSYSYNKRMKSCKSYNGNLNQQKFSPKAVITKKSPKRSVLLSPAGPRISTATAYYFDR